MGISLCRWRGLPGLRCIGGGCHLEASASAVAACQRCCSGGLAGARLAPAACLQTTATGLTPHSLCCWRLLVRRYSSRLGCSTGVAASAVVGPSAVMVAGAGCWVRASSQPSNIKGPPGWAGPSSAAQVCQRSWASIPLRGTACGLDSLGGNGKAHHCMSLVTTARLLLWQRLRLRAVAQLQHHAVSLTGSAAVPAQAPHLRGPLFAQLCSLHANRRLHNSNKATAVNHCT